MQARIAQEPFGYTQNGRAVTRYALYNALGASLAVLDYGCTITSLCVPDRTGQFVDVALGYDTIADYAQHDGFFGAAIGRVCNRIGGAAFSLNGADYPLYPNDGENTLHGGRVGFDKHIWQAEKRGAELVFSHTSPDGEEGFPGTLHVEIRYRLGDDNALTIRYRAISDQDTLCALTNHTYFNLNGGGSVRDHVLWLAASHFCEADAHCLPTGRILPVSGTPMDFSSPKPIGCDIDAPYAQLSAFGGYDHNYALDKGGAFGRAATLYAPQTGILMTTMTDQRGIQLYTGNSISTRRGKGGAEYGRHSGVCLETQGFPDAIHHANFPSCVLRNGEPYTQETVYRFSAEGARPTPAPR